MRNQITAALLLAILCVSCAQPRTVAPTAPAVPTLMSTTIPTVTIAPTLVPTSVPTATIAPTQAPAVARLSENPCDFTLPAGRKAGINARCATLRVPADRAHPDGPSLELALAVLPALGSDPLPDPIVYLDGGPGGETLGGSSDFFTTAFATALQQRRDIVLFDQRGVGHSKPSLDCPEYTNALFDTLNKPLTHEQSNARDEAAMEQCRTRLASKGIDLGWFNSSASAADVHDMMLALGYKQWNLLGVSYGTRLGLTILRDQPEGVRSAVLDSVYPPFVDRYVDLPAAAQRAFDTLFQGCADDPACAKAYPNLEERFYALARRLDQQPLTAQPHNYVDGRPYDVRTDGNQLVNMLFASLYFTDFIPDLPDLIARADGESARGETSALSEWGWVIFLFEGLSEGDYYAVECSEEAPFNQPEDVDVAAAKVHPELRQAFGDPEFLRYCPKWAARPADSRENQAITSAIPTLLLAGQYDPVTPPSYAKRAAATLSNATVVDFPGLGHATFSQPCPMSIYTAFFDDPIAPLDTSCVQSMKPPAFRVAR